MFFPITTRESTARVPGQTKLRFWVKTLEYQMKYLNNIKQIYLHCMFDRARYGNREKINFQQFDFSPVNLNNSGAKIYHASSYWDISFRGSNFAHAELCDRKFASVSFAETNLSGVNFTASFFTKVDFRGANLAGAILDRIQICLLVIPDAWDHMLMPYDEQHKEDILNFYFNHVKYPRSGSIFTTIASIDGKYQEVKEQLLYPVLEKITSLIKMSAGKLDFLDGMIDFMTTQHELFNRMKFSNAPIIWTYLAQYHLSSPAVEAKILTILSQVTADKTFVKLRNDLTCDLISPVSLSRPTEDSMVIAVPNFNAANHIVNYKLYNLSELVANVMKHPETRGLVNVFTCLFGPALVAELASSAT